MAVLVPHPAARWLAFAGAGFTIWRRQREHRRARGRARLARRGGLLTRPDGERRLARARGAASGDFLDACASGRSCDDALESVLARREPASISPARCRAAPGRRLHADRRRRRVTSAWRAALEPRRRPARALDPLDAVLLVEPVAIGASSSCPDGRRSSGVLDVTDQAVGLFRDEYRLPLVDPAIAAHAAAYAEHLVAAPARPRPRHARSPRSACWR